jgi:hypothetical protein
MRCVAKGAILSASFALMFCRLVNHPCYTFSLNWSVLCNPFFGRVSLEQKKNLLFYKKIGEII